MKSTDFQIIFLRKDPGSLTCVSSKEEISTIVKIIIAVVRNSILCKKYIHLFLCLLRKFNLKVIIKWELFKLLKHNLIWKSVLLKNSISFKDRTWINLITKLKRQIYKSVLAIVWLCPYVTLQGVAEKKPFFKYERWFWHPLMLAVHMDSFQRDKGIIYYYIPCVYGYLRLDLQVHLLEGGIQQMLHMVFLQGIFLWTTLDKLTILSFLLFKPNLFRQDGSVCGV